MTQIKRIPTVPQIQPQTSAPLVSVIVPTYCEVDNLRELVLRLSATLHTAGMTYEVIIVDDNSQDGTDEVVQILELEGHPVRLITRMTERGLSTAVLHGFSAARGNLLVCMDADLSHPPEKVPEMIRRCTEDDADFVIGVPDSGIPAATRFAHESGLPYGEGLAKNRYVGRTFISPSQTIRQQGIRLKLNPLASGPSPLVESLMPYLSRGEIAALGRRADQLLEYGRFPDVHPNRRPYPWPPV